ncbi:HTH-type transcriptional repressor CsiR [compost metagenome]
MVARVKFLLLSPFYSGTEGVTEKTTLLSRVLPREQLEPHLARTVIEERLRNAIIDGRLPSGTALRQQELATLFGVSRMPVREALRQLEAQSLLQVVAHKGAVVAPLIGEDAVDTYGLRILLETEALRQSIPRLDADDIATARHYIGLLEGDNSHAEMGRLNRLFHMALYAKAPNRKLLRMIEVELNEEERFLRFHLSSMGLGKLTQDDHRALADAAAQKDIDKAVGILNQHLCKGLDAMKNYLDSRPPAER